MGGRNATMMVVIAAVVIAGIELVANRASEGTLLLTLTFFTAVAQGCIVVVAIGVVAKGHWIKPVRRDLLAVYPALLLIAFLWLFMWTKLDIYRWTDTPTAYMNGSFFILRNFVVLLVSFWLARQMAKKLEKGDSAASTYAGVYIFVWVICQSLIAFDWIMSLEYPFISTLFGGYFFVQSLLLGLTVSAWIIFFRRLAGARGLTETLRDTGKMMFSFSFMWAGFGFTQYLVIWYGNLPEEVAYVLRRVDPSPYWGLYRVVFFSVFVIPFVTLVFRKTKTFGPVMIFIALLIECGLMLEKILMITPITHINPALAVIEAIVMITTLAVLIRNRDIIVSQLVTSTVAERSHSSSDLASAPQP
ncbi:MAG: hypothetical protein O7D32_01965 [bacterium]|nr:hypothetical protein [bacterium]